MKTDLIVSAFNGRSVRSAIINGEAICVAKDVCAILGISKYRDAIRSLDDDERVSIFVDTPGGRQEMQGVNKFGIHSLILKSNRPEAKAFKRWIIHEILPSIEKTGSYGVSTTLEYLTKRLDSVEAELFAARKILDFYENCDDVFDFDYVADAVSQYRKPPFGVKHLCQWLASRDVLTHRAYKNNKPRQEYLNNRWFVPRNHTWIQRGKCRHIKTYLFTARGLNGVLRMAIEEKLLVLPTPAQSIFPILIDCDGTRRIG